MGWWARVSVGVLLLCAAAGCAGNARPVSLAGNAHSSQDALLRAHALLDRVYLPGAVRADSPISSFSTAGGNQVQLQRWFTVLGHASTIIATLDAHPPQGLESWAPPFQTTATSAPLSTVSAGLRPVGRVDQSQILEVLAVDEGDGRARVKMEASVGWVSGHSPLEVIPAEVTDVQLAISFANQPDEAMNRDNALTAGQVQQLATLLNSLEASTGVPSDCFDPDIATAPLTLTYGGHHASFAIEIGGCDEVNVTVDGLPQPQLLDDRAVSHLIGVILGINL